jgi:formylglycine-generating enzyme required for sulfatase activity
MADIFISFKTEDTRRIQPVHDCFRARGLSVFWSNDIPKGALNYQATIREEILKAPIVVVVWTHASVHSGPVIQECSQAERSNKLFQILLDDIEPIDMPMEVRFKAQKTMLLGWAGDTGHPEWKKLNDAIEARLSRVKVDAEVNHGAPDRWFKTGAGKIEWFKDHEHGPEMVVVPAGSFLMGSPENEPERESWEKGTESPQHSVTIAKPFAVGRHAVTRGQFAAFVNNTRHKVERAHPSEFDPKGPWRNPGFAQDDNHPVVCVNWHDAKDYAAWLAQATGKPYRLLSEAEWEYCCRGGTATPFWWGSSITPAQANYGGDNIYKGGGSKGEYRKATVPVGSFAANAWGLYQVHGNVWEWCEDPWYNSYNGAPTDGSPWGGGAIRRVVRGGSWKDYPGVLRSAIRTGIAGDYRYNYLGFRLARTLCP